MPDTVNIKPQVSIQNIFTQMQCMSVTLDQQDELRKYYHRGLRLEVSDTGYSHGLHLGPPVGKIYKDLLCILDSFEQSKQIISATTAHFIGIGQSKILVQVF
jgi:hypothetical protein